MDAAGFETEDGWLEESLWSPEALIADGDDLAVGKLVGLLEGGALAGRLDLLLEVECDVAELLLDVTNDFTLGGGGEGVAALSKDLHEVVGQVAAGHVDTRDGVWEGETFVDWDDVGDTVTGVEHDTGGTTRGVQRKHGLDGDVEGWGIEGLEDDLGHLLTIGLGVDGCLGEQDWVLLWCNTQLVVESVMPDLLHVVPVGHDAVLDWVSEGEDTTLALCLIANVGVFLAHTNHDTTLLSVPRGFVWGWAVVPMMARSTDDGCWWGSAESVKEQILIPGLTYGTQLVAHRHRRNRPCTYRSYHCRQYSVSRSRLAVSFRPPSRLNDDIAGDSFTSWLRRWRIANSPIVNDQCRNFFCKRQLSQRYDLITSSASVVGR